jgi:hypothetical protein
VSVSLVGKLGLELRVLAGMLKVPTPLTRVAGEDDV